MCADKTGAFTILSAFFGPCYFWSPFLSPCLPFSTRILGCFRATFLHLPMLKCQQVFRWLKQSGVRAPNPRTCHSPGQMAMWWWQTALLKQAYWVAKQSSIQRQEESQAREETRSRRLRIVSPPPGSTSSYRLCRRTGTLFIIHIL